MSAVKNPATAKNRTFRSSVALVKNVLSDLNFHAERLDRPESVEELIALAATASEAVKKLSRMLGDPDPANNTPKSAANEQIDVSSLSKIFAAMDTDGPLKCKSCGKIRA